MSRSEVRTTLYDFLVANQSSLTDVNVIWSSFPARIDFQKDATPGQKSRCQLVLFISAEDESRIALGGAHSGKKRLDYEVVVQVFHHSMWNDSVQVMDDFDTTVDSIKTVLRSDHNFGDTTTQLVWQGAEPSIRVDYGEPVRNNSGATETWAAIQFQVTQIITA